MGLRCSGKLLVKSGQRGLQFCRQPQVGGVVGGKLVMDCKAQSADRVDRVKLDIHRGKLQQAVGSHVWNQIMEPDEADAMVARITAAVERAAGPGGFEYTFTKTYAIARRGGSASRGRDVRFGHRRADMS